MLKAKMIVAGLLAGSMFFQITSCIDCVKKQQVPQYFAFLSLFFVSVAVLVWMICDIKKSLRSRKRPRVYGENGSTKYDTRKWTSKKDILSVRFDTSKFGKK